MESVSKYISLTDLKTELSVLFSSEIDKIENLHLGMTNNNFKCLLKNGEKYIVRTQGKGAEFLVDRENEWDVLQKVRTLGIDVEYVLFSAKTGIKVTRYIDNCKHLTRNTPLFIEQAVATFKKLHYSGLQFDKVFDFWNKMESYLSSMRQLGITLSKDFYAQLGTLKSCSEMLPSNEMLLPCHNDPVPENFLVTPGGKIFLIDWEYGGMNNPVWDLAAFSLEFELSEDEERKLIELYYRHRPDEKTLALQFLLHKTYQDFLWYVWCEIKMYFGQELSTYANMRYTRGLNNLKVLPDYERNYSSSWSRI